MQENTLDVTVDFLRDALPSIWAICDVIGSAASVDGVIRLRVTPRYQGLPEGPLKFVYERHANELRLKLMSAA